MTSPLGRSPIERDETADDRDVRSGQAAGMPDASAHEPPEDIWTAEVARRYDLVHAPMFDPAVVDPAVTLLTELADGRPALEFAIGTGRLALPLSARGTPVTGIELSPSMLSELRAKPGGDDIETFEGDMATLRVPGGFDLVYLVYNTITNLLTQDAQVACFENAAAHLVPGGAFVIETLVPQLQRLPVGERFGVFDATDTHAGIDEYDLVNQRSISHHYHVGSHIEGGGAVFRSEHRYGWPAEYDLMARIAGLELEARWSDWDRSEFTALSTSHISVWRRPAA